MSQATQNPTQDEVQAFMHKLGEYRHSLSSNEQEILDSLVAAACSDESEVTGHGGGGYYHGRGGHGWGHDHWRRWGRGHYGHGHGHDHDYYDWWRHGQ
jgi:hypothetical protein